MIESPETDQHEPEPDPQPDPAVVASIFGDNPRAAYARMLETVEVMEEAFERFESKFVKVIVFNANDPQRRREQKHITAEGWTFVGGLVGVSARTKWVEYVYDTFVVTGWEGSRGERRKFEHPTLTHGYKAMVEAVAGGAVVGASEGLCLAAESRWGDAEEYARKSMAQTRAKSQAIAGVLRFLVEMAGYKGTPAEEMDGVEERSNQERRVEGPKRAKITAWNALMEKLDYVSGFTEGVSKGLLQQAAEEAWGKKIEKFGDLPREETMLRLHQIWWALESGQNALGVAPTDLIIEKWAEFWPEVDSYKLAARISAAAGEADPPAGGDIPPLGDDDPEPDPDHPEDG